MLMDARLRASGKNAVLPPVQMYVIDEAHQLASTARSIYGAELSAETIPGISNNLLALNFRPYAEKDFPEWHEVRDAVYILANQLMALNEQLFFQQKPNSGYNGYLRNISTTTKYLRKILKESHRFKVQRDEQRKYKQLSELTQLSEIITALSENDGQIRWYERDRETDANSALCGIPKRLNERIYEDLWKRGVPTLLTSGTLSAGGDFSAFKRATGIAKINSNRLAETTQPSPYNYHKNCLLYLSNKVPHPKQSNKTYINALTDEIERLIRAAHGHTAVLFTSYNVMGRVYSKLQKRGLPFPLFKLERSTSNAIDRFKQSGNGVLFASGAMWEGIDRPGDALSMLIIVKLPFSVPDEINEYEQTLYPNFKAYLDCVLTPEMLVKLKQGFGRLIRTMTDTGCVAILDIRAFIGEAYYDRIINILPKCHVTTNISEVVSFFTTIKSLEYFIKIVPP
jgi:ATP-dependent DNA helicase DinG